MVKLTSSSLIETIVALTISTILFFIVTSIFVQVTFANSSEKKIKAHALANRIKIYIQEKGEIVNEVSKFDEYVVKYASSRIDDVPELCKTQISIYDQNKVMLDEINFIMPIK